MNRSGGKDAHSAILVPERQVAALEDQNLRETLNVSYSTHVAQSAELDRSSGSSAAGRARLHARVTHAVPARRPRKPSQLL